MGIAVEPAHHQVLNVWPTELARGKANVMHHQKINRSAIRALIDMGRHQLTGTGRHPATGVERQQTVVARHVI